MKITVQPRGGVALVLAAAFTVAAGTSAAALPTDPSGASASSASVATATWASYVATGLAVSAAARGDGPLTLRAPGSPVVDSTVDAPDGPVAIAQQTLVAADRSGEVVVSLTVLGGAQLVVDEMSPSAGFAGKVIVLEPGSSTVAGTYPQPAGVVAPAAGTTHGCRGYPQAPVVIGSGFGPLIEGHGVVGCTTTASINLIVSLYKSGTHVGTTAAGSSTTTYYVVTSYAPCTAISGTHPFQTDQLWDTPGSGVNGNTSSTANLKCG
jgi:hypothetical protein